MSRSSLTRLENLSHVGPAIAATLRRIDVREPSDLAGRDPGAPFDALTPQGFVDPSVRETP